MWENDPLWKEDPIMGPFRTAAESGRYAGYAGTAGRPAAETISKYIMRHVHEGGARHGSRGRRQIGARRIGEDLYLTSSVLVGSASARPDLPYHCDDRPRHVQGISRMKIASLETGIVLLPNNEPLAGFSDNANAKNPIVWLRLRTDDGIEGMGVTFFGGALTRNWRHAVDELGALAVGEDPLRAEAVASKLRDAAGGAGPAGIFTLACRPSTLRCGTSRARRWGQPLWKLLGGGGTASRPMPVARSGAA